MLQFDHFVVAAPDLEAAKRAFAEISGCTPADGGAHVGLGTHNALCSFGAGSYLEIVAPDPAQNADTPFANNLRALTGTTPFHWAIRTTGLGDIAEQAKQLNMATGPILDTQRKQPNGEILSWQLMGIHDVKLRKLGGLVPFFIDWKACPHPATTSPVAGSVTTFTVSLPNGPIHTLLAQTQGVTLEVGEPHLRITITTPVGEVEFSANQLSGFGL